MKIIDTNLTAHINTEVTTLATCWKLTLTNNTIIGFTDHDRDIVINSVTYIASSGFSSTSVKNNDDMAIDTSDMQGVLDSSYIKEEDVLAGLYDFAEIEVFRVNYKDTSQGKINIRKGWLGEVSLIGESFKTEVRGLSQRLSKTIGELYSPSCRAKLGDTRCKVNISSFTVSGSVTSVTSNSVFADTARTEISGYFDQGMITFTSGSNNGLSMEVKEYTVGNIILALPMPYAIAISDTYSIKTGCNKTLATCRDKYSNIINFRGEPFVPGTDRILETSSTRS